MNWSFLKNPLKFKLVHCIKQVTNTFISPEQITTLLCHLTQGKKRVKEGKKQSGVCNENLHIKGLAVRFHSRVQEKIIGMH